ncbi:DUF6059 family protein [Streptomyces sp. NPDC060002]|uniref:DUF6059 family protein n=1 Tax=Streptomyces sp. NPDC060002 TaxID=3347033 RepID=UPI0036CE67D9
MEWSARDALHSRQRHPTAAARAGRIVVRHCVLPVWRSLVAYGLMCLGLVGRDEAPVQPGPDKDTLRARPRGCEQQGQGPGAGRGPMPGVVEPPPGHPERLRPDMPLTEVERALARQLSGSLTNDDPTVS